MFPTFHVIHVVASRITSSAHRPSNITTTLHMVTLTYPNGKHNRDRRLRYIFRRKLAPELWKSCRSCESFLVDGRKGRIEVVGRNWSCVCVLLLEAEGVRYLGYLLKRYVELHVNIIVLINYLKGFTIISDHCLEITIFSCYE